MPRINKATEAERVCNKFEGILHEYRLNQGLDYEELASRMGMSGPTLRKKRKNVDELTVGDIKKLCRITGMPLISTIATVFGINSDNIVKLFSDVPNVK